MIPSHLLNAITTGDARELSRQIPDESVDLIFTDPVYERTEDYEWLAGMAARVLKTDGSLLVFQWTSRLRETLNALQPLNLEWIFSLYIPNRTKDTRCKAGFNKWTPCLWLSKGGAKCPRVADIIQCNASQSVYGDGSSNHQWSKSPEFIAYYAQALTKADSVIVDPFCGGGTVPMVAMMTGRRFVAFEIDPDTADKARERVSRTMPPLILPEPAQQPLLMAV